jgi:hypothetical protein
VGRESRIARILLDPSYSKFSLLALQIRPGDCWFDQFSEYVDILYDFGYDHIEDMHMNERVTVTLPKEIIRDIDRQERNRSRFVLQAVEKELERRRKEELRRSLRTPHRDGSDFAEAGFTEWADGLPEGDEDLVDIHAGVSVKWVPGKGWVE